MIWLWISLGALALIVGLPLLIGSFVSREHSASVARSYRQTPEEIWAAITGFDTMAEWRKGVSQVEILEPLNGKRMIREHTGFGPMTYAIETEEPARRLVLRIADTDKGFGGTWTYEIRSTDDGSELKITEDGFIDNLFFRFMARFVFGYERTMRSYHESLARKFGG